MVESLFIEISNLFQTVFSHLDILTVFGDISNGEWVAQTVIVTLLMVVCSIPFVLVLKLIDFVCGGCRV